MRAHFGGYTGALIVMRLLAENDVNVVFFIRGAVAVDASPNVV